MKTIPEILATISKKVNEHKIEVEGSTSQFEALGKAPNEYGKMLDITMKRMVLKDKIIFHKAVIAAFLDLQEEIQK